MLTRFLNKFCKVFSLIYIYDYLDLLFVMHIIALAKVNKTTFLLVAIMHVEFVMIFLKFLELTRYEGFYI